MWIGYRMFAPLRLPHFHNGIAWCHECIKGFKVRHMGFGQFVRPMTDDDKVAVKGPKLEDLY